MSELPALAQQVAAATRTVSETVRRHVTVTPLAPFRGADHDAEVLLTPANHQ
ncbi:MAG TPA: hypothetical protein VFO01_16580 [Trebonia sp.]|nr:hypothetical protein [Trebonia sp.]